MVRQYLSALLQACYVHNKGMVAVILVVTLGPLATLTLAFLEARLGINPFQTLLHSTGSQAIQCLLASLAITPLRRWLCFICRRLKLRFGRRLCDWNWLFACRRWLGLAAALFAGLHAMLFCHLELGWEWALLESALNDQQHLTAGLLAMILLLPLTATSNRYSKRRLKGRWRLLHKMTYAVYLLACIHVFGVEKSGEMEGHFYIWVGLLLMVERIARRLGLSPIKQIDNGMPVVERDG